MLVLGSHSIGRKSTRDKANTGNPKVNRCCPPLTANRTSADCEENSLVSSVQYIPLGVYHTGGFDAVYVFPKMGEWVTQRVSQLSQSTLKTWCSIVVDILHAIKVEDVFVKQSDQIVDVIN